MVSYSFGLPRGDIRLSSRGQGAADRESVVVRNVSKVYRGDNSLVRKRGRIGALSDTSFSTSKGEAVGILGPNGSGKSTLLRIIAGTEQPTTGEVYVSSIPTHLGVSAAMLDHLSGLDNARLGLLAMGLSRNDSRDLSYSVTEWADLKEAENRPLKTYSSGMRARLKFAISTAVPREILLVDEALSTGDTTFVSKAEERMNEMLRTSGTVFIVSHSPGTIERFCSRAIWLHRGEVIADGDPEYLAREYKSWSRHTSAGRDDEADWIIDNRRGKYRKPIIELI